MRALPCARASLHVARRGRTRAMATQGKELLGYQERNRGPILEALQRFLAPDATGPVVEIACGNGAHAAFFASAFPKLDWLPTDVVDERFPSVRAWAADVSNMRPPVILDCSSRNWQIGIAPGTAAAVLCINMCHISPWQATLGLFAGAGAMLRPGGWLFIYGPFMVDGKPTTESNAEFHRNLMARDPSWGYRDLSEMQRQGEAHGLRLVDRCSMPADNFFLAFQK